MAKNVILMVGDGMGWEMARAAAIAKEIATGDEGNTLDDFYTEGKGEGLSLQTLQNYDIATTYSTIIDGELNNSALEGAPEDRPTGEGTLREGFNNLGETEDSDTPSNGEGDSPPEIEPTESPIGFDPRFNPDGVPGEGNLVGYDPERGGPNPWTPGSDPEYIQFSGDQEANLRNVYPDSANTATTLNTGVKTFNAGIGVDIFEQDLDSLQENAVEEGKAVGVVTSVPITHATPAGVTSHVNSRGKYDDEFPALDNILQQTLRDAQPAVLLGGGHPLDFQNESSEGGVLNYEYITESTYEELSNNPDSNIYGYQFLERGPDAGEALLETAADLSVEDGERLIGLYGARGQNGNLPNSSADGDYSTAGFDNFSVFSSAGQEPDTVRPLLPGETDEEFIAREVNENPTLAQMTSAALDVLEDDQDGFYLMVEGGDIDWAAHDNNMDNLLGTVNDFDNAVQTTLDWIEENGGFEENQLIITSDHDHYLTLNEDFPELLRENGAEALTAADNPEEAGHYWGSDPGVKYGWGSHTNRPVPVYSQGEGSELLGSFEGEGYELYGTEVQGIPGHVDQTHIYQTMYAALTGEEAPVPPLPELEEPSASPFVFGTEEADVLEAEGGEIVFGGEGDDILDASIGEPSAHITSHLEGENRLYGDEGDDILIGAIGDRLVGGEGDDALFAGDGGSSLTGGSGIDQFWIAYAGRPRSGSTITDFQEGIDVIGIAGLSEVTEFADLTLTQSGADTRINISDPEQTIAILTGVQADGLDASNFVLA